MLAYDEGERLKPYRDTVGKLTIGIGRNLDDVGINSSESRMLVRNDIFRAINGAYEILGEHCFESLSEPRQHAVINLIFNLGAEGFQKFHNAIDAIRSKDWLLAAKHLRHSKWYSQVGNRAERVILLLEREQYAEKYIK